ncbi:MAG: TlpA disulfide reductase family protein [Thalassotalea sp.]|nr:TlpA disulfide reductase family protein [Thalassotalea sp.]
MSVITTMLQNKAFATSDSANISSENLATEIAKHKGDVIYLDFWASWCVPCRRSFPWMNQVQNQYKDQGFTVISVNLDAEYELAQEFLKQTPANFVVVYDPQGLSAKQYKLRGMPSSYLIGRDGSLQTAHIGFYTERKPIYEEEIKHLLAQ